MSGGRRRAMIRRSGAGKGGGRAGERRGGTLGIAGAARRFRLVAGLAVALVLAASGTALAVTYNLPGEKGARDTKVLVFNNQVGLSGRYDDGTSDAVVMWSHDRGVGQYYWDVYRHDRTNGRNFVKVGSCWVSRLADGTTYVAAGQAGSQCSWDKKYRYVVFKDTGLLNYEEYYYLVALRSEGFSMAWLNQYAVTAAFPPSQTRHGNYSEYTNACNACHGLHSSKFKKLLKGPTVTDLCGTCHDGTGSKYDEVRGRVRLGDSWSKSAYAPAGPFGDRLKGGSGVITTSVHNVLRSTDGQELNGSNELPGSDRIWQAPGSGWLAEVRAAGDTPLDLGISNDWGSQLVCSSCHEPHNRAKNYRILRGVVNDRTYILVRGVSEVDRNGSDASPDRGEWGGGDVNSPVLSRAMYTRYLTGGNSVLTYKDTTVEDKAFACTDTTCSQLAADAEDLDGDGNTAEEKARAYCELANRQQNTPNYGSDPLSPTGVRCSVDRPLGGVTSFCTACHRAFIWSEAWIGRYGAADGSTSGYDSGSMTFGDIPGRYSAKKAVTTAIEDTDAQVAYTGMWSTVPCAGCSGGTETVSSGAAGESAVLSFMGTQVDVLAAAAPDRGIVDVYLDGVFQERINLYNPGRVDKVKIYSWAGPSASHTLELRATGQKDPSSSGAAVGLDAFLLATQSFSYTYSLLGDVPGEHKHPIGMPAMRAYREGRLVEGVLSSNGDVCTLRLALAGDPRCSKVGQGRLIDPVVPLEGLQTGKWQLQSNVNLLGTGYTENTVVCLTCHVAHGSGSERLEVAYFNGDVNDTQVYTCVGYDGDGYCGNDPGESLGPALTAKRDSVMGYLWNRLGDATRTEDRLTYVCENNGGDPNVCGDQPGERWVAKQDGVPDGSFPSKVWDFTEPVFDATGKKLERWETAPAFVPNDTPNWTQLGFSSALARFNPMASVCYRCHSTTPNASLSP